MNNYNDRLFSVTFHVYIVRLVKGNANK